MEGMHGNKNATLLIDVNDIIIAILLIKGLIVAEGIFIGSSEFTLTVSGTIFGVPFPEPFLPRLQEEYNLFRKVTNR
ncbi:hypothetical protein [Neobacillus vireti]|uniref:Uncharacterized protein n=1 Tax=Neobacillus vireti LMG 21834 TaxID=1131730 RepID=A0AB94ISR3_9BACI|nr:hypothetical protein [Neobacillus vireti]ETI70140.1 hypothetical protein BAVI_03604 [Neobacillus vireti LMG 21834]